MTTDRCEWNPIASRPATEPASDGDCPNKPTLSVGGSGRFHLCATCAVLPAFEHLHVRKPLGGVEMSADERLKQILSMSGVDDLRAMLANAMDVSVATWPALDRAHLRVILRTFGHLLDDKRSHAAIRRAVRKVAT